jgi:DNA-directed RNA polymerase specialized sigma24 family protein
MDTEIRFTKSVPFTDKTTFHTRQPLDEIDDLVSRACEGDTRAIRMLGVTAGPDLVKEARSALGGFKDEAKDVVQDVFLAMLEGKLRFMRRIGHAMPWLKSIVRVSATKRRSEREREWGRETG